MVQDIQAQDRNEIRGKYLLLLLMKYARACVCVCYEYDCVHRHRHTFNIAIYKLLITQMVFAAACQYFLGSSINCLNIYQI